MLDACGRAVASMGRGAQGEGRIDEGGKCSGREARRCQGQRVRESQGRRGTGEEPGAERQEEGCGGRVEMMGVGTREVEDQREASGRETDRGK